LFIPDPDIHLIGFTLPIALEQFETIPEPGIPSRFGEGKNQILGIPRQLIKKPERRTPKKLLPAFRLHRNSNIRIFNHAARLLPLRRE
jgi:hypothetical protein